MERKDTGSAKSDSPPPTVRLPQEKPTRQKRATKAATPLASDAAVPDSTSPTAAGGTSNQDVAPSSPLGMNGKMGQDDSKAGSPVADQNDDQNDDRNDDQNDDQLDDQMDDQMDDQIDDQNDDQNGVNEDVTMADDSGAEEADQGGAGGFTAVNQ